LHQGIRKWSELRKTNKNEKEKSKIQRTVVTYSLEKGYTTFKVRGRGDLGCHFSRIYTK
jgi:hypothetical protein